MSQTVSSKKKEDYSALVNRAVRHKERVKLTRGGKDVAAVIPIEDLELLEALEDRLDVLEALDAIKEAREKGGTIPWEQFEAELDRP
jgi:prevent-host-death family protein